MVILLKTTIASKATSCVQHLLKIANWKNKCDSKNIINIIQLTSADRLIIGVFLNNICQDCAIMASLPQGAFAACKLRDNRENFTISHMKSGEDKSDMKNSFENKKLMEYSPVKYNGKLMNSIWGLYNRYSPHNIKGNEYGSQSQPYFLQQPTAVASFAIAQNMAMAMESGTEWCFPEE